MTLAIQNHIGMMNPFRYRGYHYDTQTGLYYLPQRYYNPQLGRFLNADTIENADLQAEFINGYNLYAYCLNNPVNEFDPTGGVVLTSLILLALKVNLMIIKTAKAVKASKVVVGAVKLGKKVGKAALIGGAIGASSNAISQGMEDGWRNINPAQVAFNGLTGAATGAFMASPLGALGTGIAIGGVSATRSVGNDLFDGNRNAGEIIGRAAVMGAIGGLTSGLGKGIINAIQAPFANAAQNIPPTAEGLMHLASATAKGIALATSGTRAGLKFLINRTWRSS